MEGSIVHLHSWSLKRVKRSKLRYINFFFPVQWYILTLFEIQLLNFRDNFENKIDRVLVLGTICYIIEHI